MAIHAGDYFSEPANPPNAGRLLFHELQTVAGNEYADTWSISFLPTGMVSRRLFNNSITLSERRVGSAVAEIVGNPPTWRSVRVVGLPGGSIETTVKWPCSTTWPGTTI